MMYELQLKGELSMSKFLKVIVNLILLSSILVAAALMVPPLAGVSTVIADQTEMNTTLKQGTVVYAKSSALNEVSAGDKVLSQEGDSAYVYEILAFDSEGASCQARDVYAGDGAVQNITLPDTAEKVLLTVPYIGYVALALKTTEGLIIVGLVVLFVIILFVLSELWKNHDEDDYDEDEDEYEYEEDDDEYDDEDYEEDDGEEEKLTRKERKALRKQEKERRKAAKLAEAYDEESDMDEEPMAENLPATAKEEQAEMEAEGNTIDLAAEIQKSLSIQLKEAVSEEEAEAESFGMDEVAVSEEEEPEGIRMAIPVYTAEELIEKAKNAGDDPEIIRDEESGITILDYSNIL